MIRSMTGYGEAERTSPHGVVRLEVKTVNHRFFNASLKLPPALQRHERDVVEALKRHVSRGHLSAYLTVEARDEAGAAADIDLESARRYKETLEAIQSELGVGGAIDIEMLTRLGGFLAALRPGDARAQVDPELLLELADEAGGALASQREAEGERLGADLEERLGAIEALLEDVAARAPERLVAERDRLRAAVAELAEGVAVDEERLAREVAHLAERWDINEELVRFRSHVELFRETLAASASQPVGKRLGFLVQEMHREGNTLGAKANDVEIAHAAVALKEEVERIREQVENVE